MLMEENKHILYRLYDIDRYRVRIYESKLEWYSICIQYMNDGDMVSLQHFQVNEGTAYHHGGS